MIAEAIFDPCTPTSEARVEIKYFPCAGQKSGESTVLFGDAAQLWWDQFVKGPHWGSVVFRPG